jgi:transcriptional regulator of arginine metabolism
MYIDHIKMHEGTASRKPARQEEILRLVRAEDVATQEELRKLLHARGHDVNQGTLSRDIHELGLVKAPYEGGVRYAVVEGVAPAAPADALAARMAKAVDVAGQLIVIKTEAGAASPLGIAIDRLAWPGVVGTVAGDDTLLIVARDGAQARAVAKRILRLRGA